MQHTIPYTPITMTDNKPPAAETILNGDSAQARSREDVAKKYDLLPKLIPHLDRHLVFPLFEILEDDPAPDTTRLKYELLKETNMTDFVGELYRQMNNLDQVPEEYVERREEVLRKRERLQDESSAVTRLLENDEVINNLRSDKVANLNYLKEHHGVTVEMVNSLYEFGQFQYSCGDYTSAAELLYQFRVLVSRMQQHTSKREYGADFAWHRSLPITTRSPPPHGASWHPRS